MRRRIKDRGGGGGVRRGIEGVAACDERHGGEANEGFARAGTCREAWKEGAWLGEGLFVGRSGQSCRCAKMPAVGQNLPFSEQRTRPLESPRYTRKLTVGLRAQFGLSRHSKSLDSLPPFNLYRASVTELFSQLECVLRSLSLRCLGTQVDTHRRALLAMPS